LTGRPLFLGAGFSRPSMAVASRDIRRKTEKVFIVSNRTILIGLAMINRLDLFPKIFPKIYILLNFTENGRKGKKETSLGQDKEGQMD
jgi:hypothetical protein